MKCKKCRQMVDIDARDPGAGGTTATRVSRIPPRTTGSLAAAVAPSVPSEDSPHEPAPSSMEPRALGQALDARPSAPAPSRRLMPDLNDPDLWLHLARNVASSEPPPPTSGTMRRRRFGAAPTRWFGISGLAAVVVATACWLAGRAEHGSASDRAPMAPSSAPPLAAAPREPDAPSRPSTESAPPATSSATPALDVATPEQAASPPSAPPYDTVKLKQILRWAVRNGEECHKGGRSIGTAQLFITFSPSGKVSEAQLVGEPIASAPVGRCILDYARAIFLPPFDGPSFTVSRTITLR
jgi:hypothetical protein